MSANLNNLPTLDGFREISKQQINEFHKKGHVLIKSVINKNEVGEYRNVIANAADKYNTEKRKIEDRDTYGRPFCRS